jgi:hypothetical protein
MEYFQYPLQQSGAGSRKETSQEDASWAPRSLSGMKLTFIGGYLIKQRRADMESQTYISLKRDVGSIFVVQWIATIENGKVLSINEIWSPYRPCSIDESELLDQCMYSKYFRKYIDHLECVIHEMDKERPTSLDICTRQTDETDEIDKQELSDAEHIY